MNRLGKTLALLLYPVSLYSDFALYLEDYWIEKHHAWEVGDTDLFSNYESCVTKPIIVWRPLKG